MWIFLSNSYLSIVAPTPRSIAARRDHLVVRARAKGDIERVFPRACVAMSRNRDYAFRTTVPREEVAKAMTACVNSISYTNFKDSVTEKDRSQAYLRTWSAMNDFQDQRGHGGLYNLPFWANYRDWVDQDLLDDDPIFGSEKIPYR